MISTCEDNIGSSTICWINEIFLAKYSSIQITYKWQHKLNMEVSSKQLLKLPELQSQMTSTI